jgi:hypothetical protein
MVAKIYCKTHVYIWRFLFILSHFAALKSSKSAKKGIFSNKRIKKTPNFMLSSDPLKLLQKASPKKEY